MTNVELWELYERLNDENRILHKELGSAIVAANEGISLAVSKLLMEVNTAEKIERIKQLNMNETQIKSLFIVACRNQHFEVCSILQDMFRNILGKAEQN